MKEEEFNLSDRIVEKRIDIAKYDFLDVKDVKKAVELLRESLDIITLEILQIAEKRPDPKGMDMAKYRLQGRIDQIFGDKLV